MVVDYIPSPVENNLATLEEHGTLLCMQFSRLPSSCDIRGIRDIHDSDPDDDPVDVQELPPQSTVPEPLQFATLNLSRQRGRDRLAA